MSIPKEPRQLMINLMYLVLTAMLALNVSAEVMNAFFTLDDGNKNTMKVVEGQLDQTVVGLNSLLDDESKAKFRPIQPAIEKVRATSREFNQYIDQVRNDLIDESGNIDGEVNAGDFKEEHDGDLRYIKGAKNKDVTTRILVDGGRGEEIKQQVLDTRQELINAYSELVKKHGKTFGLKQAEIDNRIKSVANDMAFKIDDEEWQNSDKKSWTEYKFYHMPVAAVLPLLSQMQADLKASEANMINDMASLAGGRVVEFDQFFPVVNADRSYVVSGESINAKVSVGTYSSSLDASNVTIKANGRPLKVNADGTANLTIPASGSGQKSIPLSVTVKNPLTGEVNDGKATFTYEVGSRSVAVSADEMNVFYMGVDNPLTVSASGVSSNDVRVSFSGGITGSGSGSKYVVKGQKPGEAKVTVTAKGKPLGTFPFRVKRIPDPLPRLGKKSEGAMGNGEFRAYNSIRAELKNFDFDARCDIAGFTMVRVPRREDAMESLNPTGKYNAKTARLAGMAKPGDTYYFKKIKAKCPGDKVGRALGSMVFTIR